jgi:hypothetical protein
MSEGAAPNPRKRLWSAPSPLPSRGEPPVAPAAAQRDQRSEVLLCCAAWCTPGRAGPNRHRTTHHRRRRRRHHSAAAGDPRSGPLRVPGGLHRRPACGLARFLPRPAAGPGGGWASRLPPPVEQPLRSPAPPAPARLGLRGALRGRGAAPGGSGAADGACGSETSRASQLPPGNAAAAAATAPPLQRSLLRCSSCAGCHAREEGPRHGTAQPPRAPPKHTQPPHSQLHPTHPTTTPPQVDRCMSCDLDCPLSIGVLGTEAPMAGCPVSRDSLLLESDHMRAWWGGGSSACLCCAAAHAHACLAPAACARPCSAAEARGPWAPPTLDHLPQVGRQGAPHGGCHTQAARREAGRPG